MQNPYYFFKDCFVPVTLVVPTPDVDEALKKNGDGFNIITLLNLYTTVVPGGPIRLRIVDPPGGSSRTPDTSVVLPVVTMRWLTLNVLQNQQRFQFLMIQPTGDLPEVSNAEQCAKFQADFLARSLTPWFDEYRFKYFRSLGPATHEQFEHPIACLLLTTSADNNPVETFKKLFNVNSPPDKFPRYMDPFSLLFNYVIIHDASSGIDISEAQKKLQLIQKNFKASACHLVTINSSPTPAPMSSLPSFPKLLLTKEDLESVQNMVRSLALESIIPYLQTTLHTLHEEVNKVRSSFSDWVRRAVGSKSSKIEDKDGPRYPINSLEFRERRLADWAFMIGDWAVAYKTYKSLCGVYENDKLHAYVGSANEMMAICLLMLREAQQLAAKTPGMSPPSNVPSFSWNDIEEHFKLAWTHYTAGGKPAWARRSALAHGYWAQWKQQPSAALVFETLAEQPNVDSLERALLLQQASFSYLLRPTPRLRKYSYQMLQSADYFSQCNQLLHALAAYKAAYAVCGTKKWLSIEDYLHFRIARLSFSLNKLDQAMKFISLLLENNDESPDQQNSYLREFLYIFSVAKREGSTLPLPLLGKSVILHLPDFVSQIADPEWSLMEDIIMEFVQPPERRMLYQLKKATIQKDKIAVVGETIYVELELRNPLKVPVQFTDVHVVCKLVTPSGSPKFGTPNSSKTQSTEKSENDGDAPSEPALITENYDILLAPLEVKKVQFAIRPTEVGVIHITGIEFKLCGIVSGVRGLPAPHPVVKVTSPQPRLMPALIDWPDSSGSLLIGQIHRATLRLTNAGKMPLKSLAFSTSHPHFFVSEMTNDDDIVKTLLTTTSQQQTRGWVGRIKLQEPLNPGMSIDVPLWLRPTTKGTHNIKFLFYYEPVTPSPEMKHRLQRAVASLRVLSSMRLSYTLRPDPTAVDQYLLTVEAESLLKPGSKSRIPPTISIREIRFHSEMWTAEHLNAEQVSHGAGVQPIEIPGKHTRHLFFSIKRKPQLSDVPTSIRYSPIQHVLEGVPHVEFLNRERLADKLAVAPKAKPTSNFNFDSRTREEIAEANRIALITEQCKLNIVVLWEIGTRNALCQHNIMNITLVPESPWTVTSEAKPPLRFLIESPLRVEHDFSKGFCCVPLKFKVFNTSPFTPISVRFEGLKPTETLDDSGAVVALDIFEPPSPSTSFDISAPTAPVALDSHGDPSATAHPPPSPVSTGAVSDSFAEYVWAGTTRCQIPELGCLQEDSFEVSVCFPKPGVFNITRYRFVVQSTTGPHRRKATIYSVLQHHVTVVDTSPNPVRGDSL